MLVRVSHNLIQVCREFATVNRMEGYFTVPLPLALDTNAMTVDAGKSIKAKFQDDIRPAPRFRRIPSNAIE